MKILHLNNEKTWRGGERQTFLLAESLQKMGVENSIACRPGGLLWQHAKKHGVPVIPLSGNGGVAMLQLACVARRFDILHSHTARSHSIAAMMDWFVRRPIIATRRVDFEPAHTWFNHFKYRSAAKVVAIGGFIQQQLADWGVPREKLTTISSSIPVSADNSPDRAALRRELNLPLDRPIIGNIAALVDHKDHATLLRAALVVANQRPDVLFVIMGEGHLRDALRRQQRELGLDQAVRFCGYVPEAQRYMRAFEVFAMSSSMEGLGSIVLDAFAAKVPVVSTAAGGLPELVRDGETGLLVTIGDSNAMAAAIVRLLGDRELVMRITARSRGWVEEEFVVERMAERYLKLYKEVLGK